MTSRLTRPCFGTLDFPGNARWDGGEAARSNVMNTAFRLVPALLSAICGATIGAAELTLPITADTSISAFESERELAAGVRDGVTDQRGALVLHGHGRARDSAAAGITNQPVKRGGRDLRGPDRRDGEQQRRGEDLRDMAKWTHGDLSLIDCDVVT